VPPFSRCAIKERGDTKEISEPEYQVYPSRDIGCTINPPQAIFQQVLEEDVYPESASRSYSLQGLQEPALSGVH